MPEIRNFILQDENGNETLVDIVSKVDTTLSQENIPADSKTVGTNIIAINQKITNIENILNENSTAHLQRIKVDSIDSIDINSKDADKYIYMVAKNGDNGDHYDEYMVIDGAIEKIGNWSVDLSDYVKIETFNEELIKKIDKVEGQRLMTNAEGTKLEGIQTGAEANIISSVDGTQFSIDENRNLSLLDIAISKVTGLVEILTGKVDTVEGKGLSTHDLTDELLNKLNTADANVIEIIKVNGAALPINDKSVDIIIPTATSNVAGIVKSSIDENKVSVADDGTMEVNSININNLVQTEGDEIVFNSGASSAY